MKKYLVRYEYENMTMTLEAEGVNIMAVMYSIVTTLMTSRFVEDVKQIHIEEVER